MTLVKTPVVVRIKNACQGFAVALFFLCSFCPLGDVVAQVLAGDRRSCGSSSSGGVFKASAPVLRGFVTCVGT